MSIPPPPPPVPGPPTTAPTRRRRRGRHRWGVRARITLAAVLAVAVALTAVALVVLVAVRTVLVNRQRSADVVAVEAVARLVERGVPPLLAVRAPSLRGLALVQVLRPDGTVQAASASLADAPALVGADALAAAGPEAAVLAGEQGESGALQVTAATATSPRLGPLVVVAASLPAQVEQAVVAVRQVLVVVLPVLCGVVGILAWVLVGRALRPVEAIRAEADAIEAGTLDRRVPDPGTDDEVGRLARTVNHMLDRLERAARRQAEFVSDASHELRSPLAAIRAEVEVAQRRPDPDWPAVAAGVLAETERMERLVVDLLELARTDESGGLRRVVDVDVDDLVLAEVALPRRVPVDASGVSAGRVRGDPDALGRVVRNLLDNAARHATTGVAVAVGVEPDGAGPGEQVVVVVDDDGPGVPADQRDRIFERFARAEGDRTRADGGFGLGLALVRAVVAAHGGTAEVGDAPGGGARFRVRLPVDGTAAGTSGPAPPPSDPAARLAGHNRRRGAGPGAGEDERWATTET